MTTTHVKTASQLVDRVNDTGDERLGLNMAGKSRVGKVARILAIVGKNSVLTAVSTQVMAFHDWISDPPMTQRDRNKLYIIETQKASKRRRLAGR